MQSVFSMRWRSLQINIASNDAETQQRHRTAIIPCTLRMRWRMKAASPTSRSLAQRFDPGVETQLPRNSKTVLCIPATPREMLFRNSAELQRSRGGAENCVHDNA